MTLPWWTGIPAATATVSCGGENHRLIWENGSLTAPDHGDPDGERALMALGGEPLACIEMLDVWERHATDPDMLLLGSRGAADLIAPPNESRPQLRPGPRPGIVSERDEEDLLARLLSLGGGLGRRLDATVAAYWRERLRAPDPETERLGARLHAALYGRVLFTLSAWLGQTDVQLELEVLPERETPSLKRAADRSWQVALPFSWLVEVWPLGLETVWGSFCLAATTVDGREWGLRTVGPALGEPSGLRVVLPA